MTTHPRRKTHFLSVLHALVIVAIACSWGHWFWQHTPARALMAQSTDARATGAARSGSPTRPLTKLAPSITARFSAVAKACLAAAGDVVTGALVLTLFAIGTGVYVRRLEIWLQARRSGQAVALGSAGMKDATLEANADRGGLR